MLLCIHVVNLSLEGIPAHSYNNYTHAGTEAVRERTEGTHESSRLQSEEVRQGQRLRNTHVTTRIPKPHIYYACIVYVRRYARHVNYPRVTIRQPNFTGQFLALLTGYAKTVLSHD